MVEIENIERWIKEEEEELIKICDSFKGKI